MTLPERLGTALGSVVAPAAAVVTRLRRARVFHPRGDLYGGTATAEPSALEDVGRLLAGPVLARFSGGLWKHAQPWPDALGVSLRFHSGRAQPPGPADQDVLLISSRSLWRLPAAVFTTDRNDFLRNTYYAGPPFRAEGAGFFQVRLVPERAGPTSGDRRQRLAAAVAAGGVGALLQARPTGSRDWFPLVRLVLTASVAPDPDQVLCFSPFRNGRGVVPAGFTHAVRRHVYRAAHDARQSGRFR